MARLAEYEHQLEIYLFKIFPFKSDERKHVKPCVICFLHILSVLCLLTTLIPDEDSWHNMTSKHVVGGMTVSLMQFFDQYGGVYCNNPYQPPERLQQALDEKERQWLAHIARCDDCFNTMAELLLILEYTDATTEKVQ